MKLTPQFYLISDLHFGHKGIEKYRVDDYDSIIAKNWNKVVSKRDSVLVLGDLTLASKEESIDYFKRLRGNKFLIRGNHDGHTVTWYQDCRFRVVEPIYKVFKDKYGKRYPILFTHEPVTDLPDAWFNIHGHIHRGVHRDYDLTNRHINLSAEAINYTLTPLYQLLSMIYKNVR